MKTINDATEFEKLLAVHIYHLADFVFAIENIEGLKN